MLNAWFNRDRLSNEEDEMGIAEAIKVLSEPLVFGNQLQIEAIRTIERMEQILDALAEDGDMECSWCDGTGWHTCSCGNERDCEECDGYGFIINNPPGDFYVWEIQEALRARRVRRP